MPRSEFRMQRLYVTDDLTPDGRLEPTREQANYLLNVLRMGAGDCVLVFNGRNGEWRADVVDVGRKACTLRLVAQTRPQPALSDLQFLFAPLKMARLDYMVQKAVEMGASLIRPVLTQHTQVTRINLDRMQANVVEAAEQCGILAVPEVKEPIDLARLIEGWSTAEPNRRLIFCDEGEETNNPHAALRALERGPMAVLIGPEGGFSEAERTMLRREAFVTPIPLGPRVLRADTAAVAALAVVQMVTGDW